MARSSRSPRRLQAARLLAVPIFLLALASPGESRGEIYRWTDEAGREHFTTDPAQVPVRYRKQAAEPRSAKGSLSVVESPEPAAGTPADGAGATGGAQVPAAAAAPDPNTPERIGGRSEAEWRADAAKYRDDIERYRQQRAQCSAGGVRWKPGAGRRAYQEEMAEAQACESLDTQLQAAERGLATLEKRAHEQGVPPGWLR
jgi:hypothetical protein